MHGAHDAGPGSGPGSLLLTDLGQAQIINSRGHLQAGHLSACELCSKAWWCSCPAPLPRPLLSEMRCSAAHAAGSVDGGLAGAIHGVGRRLVLLPHCLRGAGRAPALQLWWSGKWDLASSGVTVGSRKHQPFLSMLSWLYGLRAHPAAKSGQPVKPFRAVLLARAAKGAAQPDEERGLGSPVGGRGLHSHAGVSRSAWLARRGAAGQVWAMQAAAQGLQPHKYEAGSRQTKTAGAHHRVLGGQLQGLNHPHNLVHVAAHCRCARGQPCMWTACSPALARARTGGGVVQGQLQLLQAAHASALVELRAAGLAGSKLWLLLADAATRRHSRTRLVRADNEDSPAGHHRVGLVHQACSAPAAVLGEG